MREFRLVPALVIAALLLPGCSKSPEAPPGAPTGEATLAAPATTEPASASVVRACEMISADAMSKILGTAMKAEPDDSSAGKTSCLYMPVEGVVPYAILTVARGDGDAAMSAMGVAGQVEPGLANPYAGIGDEAFAVGEMLNIRSGEDLMQVTLSGVDDVPATARAIYDAAKSRM